MWANLLLMLMRADILIGHCMAKHTHSLINDGNCARLIYLSVCLECRRQGTTASPDKIGFVLCLDMKWTFARWFAPQTSIRQGPTSVKTIQIRGLGKQVTFEACSIFLFEDALASGSITIDLLLKQGLSYCRTGSIQVLTRHETPNSNETEDV